MNKNKAKNTESEGTQKLHGLSKTDKEQKPDTRNNDEND